MRLLLGWGERNNKAPLSPQSAKTSGQLPSGGASGNIGSAGVDVIVHFEAKEEEAVFAEETNFA